VEQANAREHRHHALIPRSEAAPVPRSEPTASGDLTKLEYAAESADPEENDG
jgi:hypothetical protein